MLFRSVMQLSDDLLDITVMDWTDKAAHAQKKAWDEAIAAGEFVDMDKYAGLPLGRIPGVIAEHVEKARGGKQFVIYGPDGRTESVMYDRLAMAQIAVLKRQLDNAMEQIDELRAAISA